jgi:hypothetical protein
MLVSALWVVYSYPKGLVHQVRDWYSGVAIKMARRQGGPSRTGAHPAEIRGGAARREVTPAILSIRFEVTCHRSFAVL